MIADLRDFESETSSSHPLESIHRSIRLSIERIEEENRTEGKDNWSFRGLEKSIVESGKWKATRPVESRANFQSRMSNDRYARQHRV